MPILKQQDEEGWCRRQLRGLRCYVALLHANATNGNLEMLMCHRWDLTKPI